ncbi:PAS domain-containing sensor histidine kinase [Alicyclobacillus acidiphilus]|uniref:PAS domain-containing sensor histidine kinase n=1 Tax=Alicyclobacillus acidiphilus TaxID=182455 RepID=UPI000A7B88F5|nr:PAS domain-containing sensor histidine kinase [Alicyclobacillus acidiphilus]
MLRQHLQVLTSFIKDTEGLDTVAKALRELTEINYALDEALIIAITDVRGTITFANQRFCEISKYSRSELIGQNHRIINSGYHPPSYFREMWRTIANGKIWRGELKNRAKDGTFYWMDTVIVPSLNEKGKPYQYVSFRNEITSRKLAEERLDTLIATMPDIVIFKDGEGRWLKANNAAIDFFGLSDGCYQGLTNDDLLALPDVRGKALLRFGGSDEEAWAQGTRMRWETDALLENGETRTYEVTKVPVFHNDGKRSGLIVIDQDITERKQTERFLRRADTISAVGEMASGIAHEVRNPLAAIKWSLNVFAMDHPEHAEEFQAMLGELDRVDGILSELLMLAKPQEMRFDSVRLEGVLNVVATLMRNQAKRHGVELVVSVPDDLPMVRCEPNQIKQVFINLIKNGIEAMPNGGQVAVRVRVVDHDHLEITVKDQGVGIPAELLPRLGEPFLTTKDAGTGLGLMMCHKIIKDHHGQMDIRSVEHEGTEVTVLLPTVANPVVEPPKP